MSVPPYTKALPVGGLFAVPLDGPPGVPQEPPPTAGLPLLGDSSVGGALARAYPRTALSYTRRALSLSV